MLNGRLNIRIPEELKMAFMRLAEREGYERLSTAIRDAIRQVVNRGYIRQHSEDTDAHQVP
jgi:metal-responsive CopG/Arc/MetJ family transcriptional regulator